MAAGLGEAADSAAEGFPDRPPLGGRLGWEWWTGIPGGGRRDRGRRGAPGPSEAWDGGRRGRLSRTWGGLGAAGLSDPGLGHAGLEGAGNHGLELFHGAAEVRPDDPEEQRRQSPPASRRRGDVLDEFFDGQGEARREVGGGRGRGGGNGHNRLCNTTSTRFQEESEWRRCLRLAPCLRPSPSPSLRLSLAASRPPAQGGGLMTLDWPIVARLTIDQVSPAVSTPAMPTSGR